MLRITPGAAGPSASVVKLEGKLLAPWVEELREACRARLGPAAGAGFDRSNVGRRGGNRTAQGADAANYWPSVALVDRQGNVRYTWEGELNWQGVDGEAQMRRHIKALLAEPVKMP